MTGYITHHYIITALMIWVLLDVFIFLPRRLRKRAASRQLRATADRIRRGPQFFSGFDD
jgi:hypothetical protein